jgi:hypothetical protein
MPNRAAKPCKRIVQGAHGKFFLAVKTARMDFPGLLPTGSNARQGLSVAGDDVTGVLVKLDGRMPARRGPVRFAGDQPCVEGHGTAAGASRAFPAKAGSPETLYLFVWTQFRTQNRFPLLLELL